MLVGVRLPRDYLQAKNHGKPRRRSVDRETIEQRAAPEFSKCRHAASVREVRGVPGPRAIAADAPNLVAVSNHRVAAAVLRYACQCFGDPASVARFWQCASAPASPPSLPPSPPGTLVTKKLIFWLESQPAIIPARKQTDAPLRAIRIMSWVRAPVAGVRSQLTRSSSTPQDAESSINAFALSVPSSATLQAA